MHRMQFAIFVPPFLKSLPRYQQLIEAHLLLSHLGLDAANLLADIIDLLIDDLDLNILAALVFDHQVALCFLIEQTPILIL